MMFNKETQFQNSPIGKIPEDWEVDKLETVVEIHDSKRIPLSEMERNGRKGPHPYCGANGIIDYINDYIFDGEYVLLAEDGGAYGKFENSAYVMSGKFWVNNHAHILRAIAGKTSNQFLKLVLDFLDLNPYIVGSTRKKLNQKQMREIKIPLPPVKEQCAVVGVLGVVDSAIGLVDEVIAKTERLKKGLMQTLLTRGIGHKEYKDTPIGKIPKDWNVARINQISEVHRGASPRPIGDSKYFSETGRGWIRISDVTNAYKYLSKTSQYLSELGESKSVKVNQRDLVMSICATIGKPVIIDMKACIHDGFVVFRNLSKDVDTEFLFYLLQKNELRFRNMKQTGTQGNLNTTLVGETFIPVPSLSEQKQIADILSTVDEKIELERKEKTRLEKVKRGLMDLLLTGKVRVKVD